MPSHFEVENKSFEAIADRLSGVKLTSLPLEQLIPTYDDPETLFYAEPRTLAEHKRLAQFLKAIKGKCMIVTDDKPSIRKAYNGFWVEELTLTCPESNRQFHKLLFCNF